MLTIYGPKQRFCDGVSRRNFLKIGALGLGGLTLPQLLQAEAQSGVGRSHKAVIMIFLPGGPSHQDMFDLKMDAPAEIRGEFKPISTSVPGIQICERNEFAASSSMRARRPRSQAIIRCSHSIFKRTRGLFSAINGSGFSVGCSPCLPTLTQCV